ncbi:unnamed protein product [Brachionus calyciflorus]|uniref:Uncharacterized protein n=1 Tax=Brachionus calyciflorus TaxID=104777 RepID=A0A813T3Z2_9BILA|nr:unnamed protein product [Brachionus calyciflorus]
MEKDLLCEAHVMSCGEKICHYDGTPFPIFKYLQNIVTEGYICRKWFRNLESIDEIILEKCRINELECQLKDSIVIWENNILNNCLFRELENITITRPFNDIIYNEEKDQAFKIVSKEFNCKNEIFKTTSGLNITYEETKIKNYNNEVINTDGKYVLTKCTKLNEITLSSYNKSTLDPEISFVLKDTIYKGYLKENNIITKYSEYSMEKNWKRTVNFGKTIITITHKEIIQTHLDHSINFFSFESYTDNLEFKHDSKIFELNMLEKIGDNFEMKNIPNGFNFETTILPDGEQRWDYFTMLKRNIEFMRIFINRRMLFCNYHDMDKFHIAHTQEFRLAQMDPYIRENEAFERKIFERLYREYDVGLNLPFDKPEDETNENTDDTTLKEE